MLAVLSGCATNGGGDLVGTSAFGNYDHSSPFPYTVDIIAGG
jgi:hypothetical protein